MKAFNRAQLLRSRKKIKEKALANCPIGLIAHALGYIWQVLVKSGNLVTIVRKIYFSLFDPNF